MRLSRRPSLVDTTSHTFKPSVVAIKFGPFRGAGRRKEHTSLSSSIQTQHQYPHLLVPEQLPYTYQLTLIVLEAFSLPKALLS
jgi:hypothetical protein